MEEAGVIPEYARRLADELDFDRALSSRVRQEVEDHLWESVAADSAADRLDAEQRAIANFGDPRAIAAQFAVTSLAQHARRVGVVAVLVIATVFVAMKARLAWYGLMKVPAADQFRALAEIVLSIDRLAFGLSLIAGIAGWIYIDSRRIPATLSADYRTQLRRFFLLGLAATLALMTSIAADGVLTCLRLLAMGWSVASTVPVLSMAIEIACAGALIWYLRGIAQRITATGRTARPR